MPLVCSSAAAPSLALQAELLHDLLELSGLPHVPLGEGEEPFTGWSVKIRNIKTILSFTVCLGIN